MLEKKRANLIKLEVNPKQIKLTFVFRIGFINIQMMMATSNNIVFIKVFCVFFVVLVHGSSFDLYVWCIFEFEIIIMN